MAIAETPRAEENFIWSGFHREPSSAIAARFVVALNMEFPMNFIAPDPAAHAAACEALPKPRLIIGDTMLDTGEAGVFDHVNTATGQQQGSIPLAGASDVDAAVAAARKALPAWRDMKPYDRRCVLDRMCDLIEQNADRFARISVLENGIPAMTMSHGMWPRIVSWNRYYAGWADKIDGLVTSNWPKYEGSVKIS